GAGNRGARGKGKLTMSSNSEAAPMPPSLVERGLVKWHLVAGLLWLGIALLAGLFYSLQLLQAYPLPRIALLSPVRIRMIHTNLIAFGFLTNSFFAMLNWTVPRLTGMRVQSRLLGNLILVAWNAIVLATFLGIGAG